MITAYDTSNTQTSASAASLNPTMTVGSNSNRALVVLIQRRDSDLSFATGVSDGTHAFNLLGRTDDGGAGYGLTAEIWYLVNPATGSLTITASWVGAAHCYMHVLSLYNVNQNTPVSGYQGQFATSNSTNTKKVICPYNSMGIVSVLNYGAETITNATSQLTRTTIDTTALSGYLAGAIGGITMGYTFSGSNTANSIICACSVNSNQSIPYGAKRKTLRPAIFVPGNAR